MTDKFWAAGAVPPACAVKLRLAGDTVSAGKVGEVMVKVTATVCGLFVAALEAMVTLPL